MATLHKDVSPEKGWRRRPSSTCTPPGSELHADAPESQVYVMGAHLDDFIEVAFGDGIVANADNNVEHYRSVVTGS